MIKLSGLALEIKIYLRRILYSLQYSIQLRALRKSLNILSSEETVDKIIKDKLSVSRFGDGELDMITSLSVGYDESRKSNFQNFDEKLALRLREILKAENQSTANVLVCIPAVWKNSKPLEPKPKRFVERSFVNNSRMIHKSLNTDYVYGDSYFTRYYMDFRNKDKGAYIKHLQKIWDGRDLCIIEGTQSRLGVGNDLFSNANSIVRILCPALSAFSKYAEILSAAKNITKDKLVLIALGQTATVLAYDLAENGYQAIDIGHIDVEYEWFLMKAKEKVALPNKFVNEVDDGRKFTQESNASYWSEVVAQID